MPEASQHTGPESRVRDPENLVGQSVAGRYTVLRCIGQGGMGVVYTARQEALDREVVLKVVRSASADPDAESRFQREARSLSRLSHPNVVQIFDHGRDESTGLWFIAMEYVRGITLARYRKKRGGKLSLVEFRPIAHQICEGVSEAHRAGLVHRDLKPSNVMLTSPDGQRLRVKVLDFGLSKLTTGGEPLTQANQLVGSAMYMAPEQLKGSNADARADVYALGVIFYQLLSGASPIEGDDPYHLLTQQAGGHLRPLADVLPANLAVPEGVVALVDRCLSLEPTDRPADAAEVGAALELLLAATPSYTGAAARLAADMADIAVEPSTLRRRNSSSNPPPMSNPDQVPTNSSDTQARVGMYAGLLTGGLGILVLLLVAALLVVLLLQNTSWLGGDTTGAPVAQTQVQPQVSPDVDPAALALRARALDAMRAADYERSVALLTEAMAIAPEQSDLKELLTISIDLRDKAKRSSSDDAQAEALAAAQREKEEEEARAAARRTSRRSSPQPRPRPAPEPSVGTAVVTTQPKGMQFEIPGVAEGLTPANLSNVPEGEHEVTFFLDGVAIHSQQLVVGKGAVELMDVDLNEYMPQPEPEPEPEPVPAPAPEEPVGGGDAEGAVSTAPEPAAEPEGTADEAVVAAATGELLIQSPNVFGDVWVAGKNYGPPPVVVKDLPVGTVDIEVRVGSKVRRQLTAQVVGDQREKINIR